MISNLTDKADQALTVALSKKADHVTSDAKVLEIITRSQHPLTGQRAANFRRDLEAT